MKTISPYYSFLFLLLFFSNCGMGNDQTLEFLSFEDIVCGSQNKLTKAMATNDYLYEWQYEGNRLNLDFRFRTLCNSAFRDSVIIWDKTIHILLEDTAKWHARCVCEHQSVFLFSIEDIESIKLMLDIKFAASEDYEACLDTVLILE